jgi:UDP-glucose 4-epimerase
MQKLTGKSVLVTGGAGFIGSHLVDRIAADKPDNLIVVDNLFLGKESNLEQAKTTFPALKFYREDAGNYEAMEQIIRQEKVDVIFNLAVIPLPYSLEHPRETIKINAEIASTIVELLRQKVYKTLVHFSSSEVYGTAIHIPMDETHPFTPSTPYAASKLAGDYAVLSYRKTFGLDATIVRPFNNYGPRQNEGSYAGIIPIVIHKALAGEPITIHGDGEQTRDYIFVRDVADGAVRIYEEEATRGLAINLATGHEISINQLVRTILDLMAVDVPIIHDEPRLGDVRRHCGKVDLASSIINFQSRALAHDSLLETINWYKAQLKQQETANLSG